MSSQTPNRNLTKEDPSDDAGLSIAASNANLDILDVHQHPASDITAGVLATARLGTGGDGSGTHALFDDGTFKSVSVGSPTVAAIDVTNTPAGNIAATNVQAALNELDTEKALATHNHTAAQITSGVLATALLGSGTANANTLLHGDQTWGGVVATQITSGTVPTARLGSGSPGATNVLIGNSSWGPVNLATMTTGQLPASGLGTGTPTSSKYLNGGDGTTSAWSGLNASDLSAGTVPTGTLGSGTANSTSVLFGDNAWRQLAASNILSGVLSSARLGTGTANGTKYLAGDSTWQTLPTTRSYAARLYSIRSFR